MEASDLANWLYENRHDYFEAGYYEDTGSFLEFDPEDALRLATDILKLLKETQ